MKNPRNSCRQETASYLNGGKKLLKPSKMLMKIIIWLPQLSERTDQVNHVRVDDEIRNCLNEILNEI